MGCAGLALNDLVAARALLEKQIIHQGGAIYESIVRVPTANVDIDPVRRAGRFRLVPSGRRPIRRSARLPGKAHPLAIDPHHRFGAQRPKRTPRNDHGLIKQFIVVGGARGCVSDQATYPPRPNQVPAMDRILGGERLIG